MVLDQVDEARFARVEVFSNELKLGFLEGVETKRHKSRQQQHYAKANHVLLLFLRLGRLKAQFRCEVSSKLLKLNVQVYYTEALPPA